MKNFSIEKLQERTIARRGENFVKISNLLLNLIDCNAELENFITNIMCLGANIFVDINFSLK